LISQVIFKEWCLVFHQTRYAVSFNIRFDPKLKVSFDAIKNL